MAETGARPETDSQVIDALSFPAAELYAMPAATSAFLDDAAVDVGQWIAEEVNAAFAQQEGIAFVTGNGTNKPKGFLAETTIAEASWEWGKLGYVATGVGRCAARERPERCAGRSRLCAQGRLSPERQLGDEPQDARRPSASSRTMAATICGSRRRPPTARRR